MHETQEQCSQDFHPPKRHMVKAVREQCSHQEEQPLRSTEKY